MLFVTSIVSEEIFLKIYNMWLCLKIEWFTIVQSEAKEKMQWHIISVINIGKCWCKDPYAH